MALRLGSATPSKLYLGINEVTKAYLGASVAYEVGGGAWTPAELGASLSLWLDADDASTITLNGSTVSQWSDKSGNAHHFAQATAANQPVYSTGALNGKNVINFVSTDSLTRAAIPFNDLGNNSLYVVGNRTGKAGTFNVALILARAANRTRSILFDFSSAESGRWGTYTNQPIPSPAGFVDATYKICEMIADQDTNSYQFYQGGTSQGSNGVVNSTTGFSSSSCFIGNDQFNSWLEGNIAEVIFCDEKNSDADRQRIEGYLAWKWGLEANLPVGHPYKTTPPTV